MGYKNPNDERRVQKDFEYQNSGPTTRFVFDDFPKYNMQLIRDCLKPFGFDIMDQGKNKSA
jgi:hypothetical protein